MSSASDTANVRQRPIIIKKKKVIAGGHHGGAWKVAYADFVTAMMAFFMVMWLVATVSKEQRAALFDYFKNPSMQPGKSVKPAPGQLGPGGASTSPIDLHGGLDAPRSASKEQVQGLGQPMAPPDLERPLPNPDTAENEKKKLESLMDELKEAVDKSQALEPFKDQLLLDITPEGLRIQIVDKLNRPMFDQGRTQLKGYTNDILGELAKYLNTVPNRISLSGHTDATPYTSRGADYTNWELSAERANAARRSLVAGGLNSAKVARVVGLSSEVLFDKQNPTNPINRRISIIVMTKQAEEAALKTDAPLAPQPAGVDGAPAAAADGAAAGAPAANNATTTPAIAGINAPPVPGSPAAAALDAVAKANAEATRKFGPPPAQKPPAQQPATPAPPKP